MQATKSMHLTQYKNTFLNILEINAQLKPPNLQNDSNNRVSNEIHFWNSLYLPSMNNNEPFSLSQKYKSCIKWTLHDFYLYKAIHSLHFYIVKNITHEIRYDYYDNKNKCEPYIFYLVKKKFSVLKEILDNMFLPKSFKDEYILYFSKAQKHYAALSRFASLCRLKMTKIVCNTDMYLNELDIKDPKLFQILFYKTKYYFTMCDLKRIIDTALSNLSYFYIEILPIRNPYNNIEFNYFEIIQIYFFMKKNNYNVSHLFELFYESNLDSSVFEYDNEAYIKTIGIYNYTFHSSYENLYDDIVPMLLINHNYTKKLRIHHDFPREKLVDIFRPYLHLFYLYKYYVHGTAKAFESKIILMEKLELFVLFNPLFGRKYTHKSNQNTQNNLFSFNKKDKETFNMNHISFNEKELNSYYKKNNYRMNHHRMNHHTIFFNEDETNEEETNEDETNEEAEEDIDVYNDEYQRRNYIPRIPFIPYVPIVPIQNNASIAMQTMETLD